MDGNSRHSFNVTGRAIELWERSGPEAAIAQVSDLPEEAGPEKGAQVISIRGVPGGEPLCSVRQMDFGVYEVHAADGASLARITRRSGRKLLGPRRARWSVRVGNGALVLTGKVGSWYMWLAYLVLSPLWFPFLLILALYSLFEGSAGDVDMKSPSGTRWRASGTGVAMEYGGINKVYRLDAQRLDFRIAYAQAVLHFRDR